MPAGLSQQKNAVINIWSSASHSRTTCSTSTGRGKMFFVNLSFNSDLNGKSLTPAETMAFLATSASHNCASCLPITQFLTTITAIILPIVQKQHC